MSPSPTQATPSLSRRLVLRMSDRAEISDDQAAFLEDLQATATAVPANRLIVSQGGPLDRVQVLQDGWLEQSKMLPDGRKQVVQIILPGEIVGLSGYWQETSEHAVRCLTECRIAAFAPGRLETLFTGYPRLAAALTWYTARAELRLADHLVNLGRRSAEERTVHLLLELAERLEVVGLDGRGRMEVPLSQQTLADALGLSPVHQNRVLGRLRRRGLLETEPGRLVVDVPALRGSDEVVDGR